MADGETNLVSTDLLLLRDPDHETRLFSDVISLSDTDSETNPQSLNSMSPLGESDPDPWDLDDLLVEPQCDYMSDHSLTTVGNSPPSQLFQLRGTSSGFTSRSHNIFSGLENAVKFDASQPKDKRIIEGEFKRPPNPAPQGKLIEGSPPGCLSSSPSKRKIIMEPAKERQSSVLCKKPHSVPDYLLHPERWTKYSLEDVPETSNKKNTAVAFEFMDVLKKQRKEKFTTDFNESSTSCCNQESDSVAGKILFTKPSKPEMTEQDSPGNKLDVIKKREKKDELSPVDPGQVDLAHLDYSEVKDVEDVEAWWHDKDVGELSKDRKQMTTEEKEHESVVFHSGRKRNRKNIRMKLNKDSEDD
ncbi:protein TSSC4 [Pristis pectinata]|uniref:protein TSSC4 n=1 Tax=Pristis pectinata TaxID=685728 RepID=UPI00223D4AFC|nr:protein TSSC4 [Pristis pectinata]XP_051885008.1 protein TSSC4 [Pristis pectinata]